MKKTGNIVENISQRAVKLLILVIIAAFVIETAGYTYRLDYDYLSDIVYRFGISPMKQILYAIAIALALYILQRFILNGNEEKQKKIVRYIAVADTLLLGVLLSVYVTLSHIPPHWDQLQVFYYAQEFMDGNYSGMNMAYLRIYIQQYGLIFLEELLLHVWNDYRLFQYVNVIFIMITVYMIYLISDEIFHNQRINIYALFGVTLFLPLHIYVNYVYGDLCSIAMTLMVVWGLLKFCKAQSRRYVFIAVCAATVGVLARKNTLIPLIAVLLVCLIYAWRESNIKVLFFGLIIIIMPVIANRAVLTYYEYVSEYEIDEGIPATAWIAMGLSDDGSGGIGIFNGYNEAIWNAVGGDNDRVRELVAENIRERLTELSSDKKVSYEFFRYKIFEQWGEPSFSSINETGKGINEKEGIVAFIYSDKISDMIYRYMNHHMFLIYVCVLAFVICAFNKKSDIIELTLLIAVIGGFIYSVFWEAKGKYVMPFVIFMIPYMAAGLESLTARLKKPGKRADR
ncbi:MAG: glycosyltransferase family 39 protein [Lachnospiraceae bacterium]|nr:glycosyltransferase family 39 protein [Lachnospiraceae bacterium]